MSDVPIEQVEQLTQALERMAPAFNRAALGYKKEQDAAEKRNNTLRQLDRNMQDFDRNIRRVASSAEGAIDTLGSFAQWGRGPLGLGVLTVLASRGLALSKTWQQMMNMGNSFGGSMLNMLNSAAGAGLSLDQYVEIQRKYNVLINTGGKDFLQMQKQLRLNTSAAGSYGMTVEQMTEFMGDHMEVSRKSGALQSRTSEQVVKDMQGLALTTTALAAGSDKTREEITKLASAATSSAIAIAQLRLTSEGLRGQVDKSLKEAAVGFAALPGQAGEFFSNYFADSFGGMAVFTQQGEQLINAGLSGMVSEMDHTAQKFRDGQGSIEDQVNYTNKFIDTIDENLPILRAQAMAGNDAAKQMIAMRAEMKKTTMLEIEANKKRAETADLFTGFFASLESMYSILTGTFMTRFIKAFGKVFGPMEEFGKSETFKKLEEAIGAAGEWLGGFLGDLLRNVNADGLKDLFLGFVQGVAEFAKAIIFLGGLATSLITTLATGIGWVVSGLDGLATFLGTTKTELAKWITIGGVAFLAIRKIMSLFGKVTGIMNVKAGIVNVDGGGGFGGGPGGRGRMGRMGRLARAGYRAGGGGIKGLLGGLAGGARGLGIGGAGAAAAGGGLLGSLGGLAGGVARKLPLIGGLMEAGGYVFGDKKLSMKNIGKSILSYGGGLLGGLAGGVATGGLGAAAGGVGGYMAGEALGDWLLGPDDLKSATKAATAATAATGADTETAAAAAAAASAPKVAEPINMLGKAMKEHTDTLAKKLDLIASKLDRANNYLSKIDISAQNL